MYVRTFLIKTQVIAALLLLVFVPFSSSIEGLSQGSNNINPNQAETQVSLTIEPLAFGPGDLILIPTNNLIFTPTKENPTAFGKSDLTLRVVDPRITTGTCTFRIKPYSSPDSNFGTYSPSLIPQTSTYNTQSGCQMVFPAGAQIIPRWDIEVRITNTGTVFSYGADMTYIMLFGAIGFTTTSGVPVV